MTKKLIRYLYIRLVREPWVPACHTTMWLSIPEKTAEYIKAGNGRNMSHILSEDWQLTLRFKDGEQWKDLKVV